MTNTHTADPATAGPGDETRKGLEDLDLTPDGLADTPAHQEDFDSIVHTGNS